MIMQIPLARSKSSMGQPLSHLDSKEVSSLLWIHELLLETTLASCYIDKAADSLIIAPASGTVKKVIEINPYLLGTMAGGAGASLLRFC